MGARATTVCTQHPGPRTSSGRSENPRMPARTVYNDYAGYAGVYGALHRQACPAFNSVRLRSCHVPLRSKEVHHRLYPHGHQGYED